MMTSQGTATPCILHISKITKLKSCLVGDMIKIYVGPKAKCYSVHEALLTRYEWFRKQILGASNVASQGSITLVAEDPKVFELLICWLYRKTLKAISTTDENVAKEEVTVYVDLYLRACAWNIHELQNSIMNRLRARQAHSNVLSTHVITKIFCEPLRSGIPQSPLHAYIREKLIYLVTELYEDRSRQDPTDAGPALILKPELHSLWNDRNRAFMVDYVGAVFQLYMTSSISDPDTTTGCVYHTHKEGERCRS